MSTQPSDDTTEASDVQDTGPTVTQLVLRALLPHDAASSESIYVLDRGRMVVGRGYSANILINGEKVSREHAEIYRQGPLYALRDLGSTNGTFVDGKKTHHAALRKGMVLRFGEWLGRVDELEADAVSQFREHAPGILGGREVELVVHAIQRIAASELPVVLLGQTGTGKELFARACHAFSGRSGPFHAVNCASIPIELAEAELFGYRRGAFTGAERAHDGHLRAARGGTLFLDEVAELPLSIQAKLLRAIECREVMALGDVAAQPFTARIVAATQEPLEALVERKEFRADFAARLRGAEVRLPSLGERMADVPALFHRFLARASGAQPPKVSARVYEQLCLHDFRGNVRELELLARRVMAEWPLESLLTVAHLPHEFHPRADSGDGESPVAQLETRRDHDLRKLQSELAKNGGNVALAARAAGLSRQRAYRILSIVKQSGAPDADARTDKSGATSGAGT